MKKSSINRLKKLFLGTDMFGQRVELNFNGESSINSILGAIVSLLIYITVSAFAMYRFHVMVTYGATTITQTEHANSQNLTFNFDEQNFKIAAAVTNSSWGNIMDEDYYEIVFMLRHIENGALKYTTLNSHKCTTDEILEFYPV